MGTKSIHTLIRQILHLLGAANDRAVGKGATNVGLIRFFDFIFDGFEEGLQAPILCAPGFFDLSRTVDAT